MNLTLYSVTETAIADFAPSRGEAYRFNMLVSHLQISQHRFFLSGYLPSQYRWKIGLRSFR